MEIRIEINNQPIIAAEGETLLTVLRRNGIRVPTLCHMNRFSPTGACRLCVVEVEGKRDLITSCSYPVEDGMKVLTNSQRVIKARKSLVELLLSNHPDDCLYCERNGNCELQWLAEEMNVKERRYFCQKNRVFPDHSNPSVARDPAKCILCSRCVRMCEEIQLVTAIDFLQRSNETNVNSAFGKGLNGSGCISCGQCITVCPTAALADISHIEKVQAAITNPAITTTVLLSPSVTISVAEELGYKSPDSIAGMIIAALKRCGIDKVYDLGVFNDMNILEETSLLMERTKSGQNLPVFSSCCPAWVRFVETFRPEWLPYLSGVKTPQQKAGSMLKFDRNQQPLKDAASSFLLAITPCTAMKDEASREEMTYKGISEIDAVLTIREFFKLIRAYGIDLKSMLPEQFDAPFTSSSAGAYQMGYSGGKAESVARETYFQSKKNIDSFRFVVPKNIAQRKESKVMIEGKSMGFAWISGIAEAVEYIEALFIDQRNDVHYVEVMACPGGCAGGGGQPINRNPAKTKSRKKISQEMEKLCLAAHPSMNAGLAEVKND